jgi:hypothetical protein
MENAKHTPESVADAILKAAGGQPVAGYMPYYRDRIVEAAKPFADAANVNAELLASLIEPTDAMFEAGEEEIATRRQHGCRIYAADIWRAMIAQVEATAKAEGGAA